MINRPLIEEKLEGLREIVEERIPAERTRLQ